MLEHEVDGVDGRPLLRAGPGNQEDIERDAPRLPIDDPPRDLLECLAVRHPLPELGGLRLQLVVGELLEVGLERGDVLRLVAESLQPSPLAEAKGLLESSELLGHRPRVSA